MNTTANTTTSDNPTGWDKVYVPMDEAIKQLRKLTICTVKGARARAVYLSVNQHANIADKPGHVFPVLGSIRITRHQAEKFIREAYVNFDKRGALVRLSWCDSCVFVG